MWFRLRSTTEGFGFHVVSPTKVSGQAAQPPRRAVSRRFRLRSTTEEGSFQEVSPTKVSGQAAQPPRGSVSMWFPLPPLHFGRGRRLNHRGGRFPGASIQIVIARGVDQLAGEIEFSLYDSVHHRNGVKKPHVGHYIDFSAICVDQQPEVSFPIPFVSPYMHFPDNAGDVCQRNGLSIIGAISRHSWIACGYKGLGR